MEYAFAIAIIEKVLTDRCNEVFARGQDQNDAMTPAQAAQEVAAIQEAFNKVRNG